jgi:DNA processing protein
MVKSIMEMVVHRAPQTMTPQRLLGRPLNDIEEKNAPEELHVATGRGIPLEGPRCAIVGSRKPTPEGIDAAKNIASFLASKNVVIVSGLAKGIDTAAHKAVIDAKGLTIAVLGTPLNKNYPAQNKDLQKTIMHEYWAISQFPTGSPIQRKNFVMRNRTMALICDASVIVEAGETSGSLHQGWETLRLGRPLFIWKKILEDSSLKWPRKLIEYGALELYDQKDILDALPSPNRIIQIAV